MALVLAAVLRITGGVRRGPALMGLAIPAGVLAGLILAGQAEPFPPATAAGKAFYLIALGSLLGLVFDGYPPARPGHEFAVPLYPLVVLLWLAWPLLWSGPGFLMILALILAWIGGAIWLDRFDRTADQAGALAAGVLLALAAGGAAGVALLAESVSLGLLAASVAASTLAYVIWRLAALVLIGNPGRFGATALYGGAGALLVVVALMAVQVARISLPALFVLVAMPFALLPLRRLLVFETTASQLVMTLLLGVLGAGVAAAAVGVAFVSVAS